MNKIERIKCVKAMEFLARQVKNEAVFPMWSLFGINSGDIEYGDLDVKKEDENRLSFYIEDEKFGDLLHLFPAYMDHAQKHGRLLCDGVLGEKGGRPLCT